jgi:hypothetical protein
LRGRASSVSEACLAKRESYTLDEGDDHDWHLVGVSDVLPERGVILFWDTQRPSFGISHRD